MFSKGDPEMQTQHENQMGSTNQLPRSYIPLADGTVMFGEDGESRFHLSQRASEANQEFH